MSSNPSTSKKKKKKTQKNNQSKKGWKRRGSRGRSPKFKLSTEKKKKSTQKLSTTFPLLLKGTMLRPQDYLCPAERELSSHTGSAAQPSAALPMRNQH
jgi:hypothetical protein